MAAFVQGAFGGTPINIVAPNNTQDTVLIKFTPSLTAVSFSTWQTAIGGTSNYKVEV